MARPSDFAPPCEEMSLALRSEYGAGYFYGMLSRFTWEGELRGVLEGLRAEQGVQIRRLRELLAGLGREPRRFSGRRWVGSLLTLLARALLGRRVALRVAVDAEWTMARWYSEFCAAFLRAQDLERARACQELGTNKQRHAQILQTWIDHSRGHAPGG